MAPAVLSLNHGRAGLDTRSSQFVVDGLLAKLSGQAFDLLVALVRRHQRPVGKHEPMGLVWPGLAVAPQHDDAVEAARVLRPGHPAARFACPDPPDQVEP